GAAGDPWSTAIPGAYGAGTAGFIVGTLLDAAISSVPGTLLKFDLSTLSGEASHSPLNALRKLRNHWAISSTTLTVYKEDGTTPAYSQTLTATPGADPITAISD